MPDVAVGPLSELPPGKRKIVPYKHRSIGVFNVGGELYAVLNRCPHHNAEVCRGRLGGRMLESAPHEYRYGEEGGRILACPWHHWEFDIATGRSLLEPDRYRLRTYPVSVEQGEVIVHV